MLKIFKNFCSICLALLLPAICLSAINLNEKFWYLNNLFFNEEKNNVKLTPTSEIVNTRIKKNGNKWEIKPKNIKNLSDNEIKIFHKTHFKETTNLQEVIYIYLIREIEIYSTKRFQSRINIVKHPSFSCDEQTYDLHENTSLGKNAYYPPTSDFLTLKNKNHSSLCYYEFHKNLWMPNNFYSTIEVENLLKASNKEDKKQEVVESKGTGLFLRYKNDNETSYSEYMFYFINWSDEWENKYAPVFDFLINTSHKKKK